ncbi:MAG: transcriptional regulator [Legionellales bacterium]|nr:transcriptional regulator [Legionellales bacterium]|tara:strand:- start:625 stop:894 length:270 start_codon:yes stop_codon:yes gene_type:complete
MSEEKTSLLKFPCEFPIKAMGYAKENFRATVLAIVQQYAPEVTDSMLKIKESKDGKYLSITVTIQAQSQEQLDNIYLDLNACDDVVMCL